MQLGSWYLLSVFGADADKGKGGRNDRTGRLEEITRNGEPTNGRGR